MTRKAERRPRQESGALDITRGDGDKGRITRSPRRSAYASLFAPAGRRRWWWYSYRCPACHSYQFGRARELDAVTGVRRAGCGHSVEILIARTYRSPGAT